MVPREQDQKTDESEDSGKTSIVCNELKTNGIIKNRHGRASKNRYDRRYYSY